MRVGIVGLGFHLGDLVFAAADHDFGIAGDVDTGPAGPPDLEAPGVSADRRCLAPANLIVGERLAPPKVDRPDHMPLGPLRAGLEGGVVAPGEGRARKGVVDLRPVWGRFDEALAA